MPADQISTLSYSNRLGIVSTISTALFNVGSISRNRNNSTIGRLTGFSCVSRSSNIERRVLARAVRYHVQDRVFINATKTVVFRD